MNELAKKHNVLFISSTLITKNIEAKRNHFFPQLSDLSNYTSAQIYTDGILLLFRDEYYGIIEDSHGNSTKGVIDIEAYDKHIEFQHTPIRVNF